MSHSPRSERDNRAAEAKAGLFAAVVTVAFLGLRFGPLEARYAVESLPLEAVVVLLVAFVTSTVFAAAFRCRPSRTVRNLVVAVHAGAAIVAVFVFGVWFGVTEGFAGAPKSVVMFVVQLFIALFYIGLGLLFAAAVGALVAAGSAVGTVVAGRMARTP